MDFSSVISFISVVALGASTRMLTALATEAEPAEFTPNALYSITPFPLTGIEILK